MTFNEGPKTDELFDYGVAPNENLQIKHFWGFTQWAFVSLGLTLLSNNQSIIPLFTLSLSLRIKNGCPSPSQYSLIFREK